MSAERIDMHRLQELVRLHRMGTGVRKVCRLLKMGPNTERRYRQALARACLLAGDPKDLPSTAELKQAVEREIPESPPAQQVSTAEQYADQIEACWKLGAQPKAIYDKLKLETTDLEVSYGAVKRYCRRLARDRGPRPEDVTIPVETDPGDVLQVDFGYAGKLYDPDTGRHRKTWVFVAVLGYSRHMVCRLVFDQKVETWLRVHVETFQELGGVPATVVPDNLKAAVIRAAFGVDDHASLNRSYRELARHYGFKIDPTPPRSPEKKGKVESGVKYVKRNFFKPRGEMDIAQARADLQRWVREIAGQRLHGTTGRRPLSVFETEESGKLLPLPRNAYEMILWKEATVHWDCHALFDGRLYSAPWNLVGTKVWLRCNPSSVLVFADDQCVGVHDRRGPGKRSTIESHLPPHRAALRHRNREYWQEKAERIDPEVGEYVREIFDSDDVLSRLRTVQAIVTHLEGFPAHRARAACQRAAFFGNYTYGGIKRILSSALDLQPLLKGTEARQGVLTNPRYARRPEEILQGGMR